MTTPELNIPLNKEVAKTQLNVMEMYENEDRVWIPQGWIHVSLATPAHIFHHFIRKDILRKIIYKQL